MARFVLFLAVSLLARAFAAPGSNHGTSDASDGSIAVGVVEGATFGNDAFSIAAQAAHESHNNPDPPCNIIEGFVSIFIKRVKC